MQRLTQQYADGLLAIFPARAASMGTALGLSEERIQVDFSYFHSQHNVTYRATEGCCRIWFLHWIYVAPLLSLKAMVRGLTLCSQLSLSVEHSECRWTRQISIIEAVEMNPDWQQDGTFAWTQS